MIAVRKSSLVLMVIGVLLVAGALALRFVVAPGLTDLPADLREAQSFDGTQQNLNVSAFVTGDLGSLVPEPTAITARTDVAVIASEGDTAILRSSTALTVPDESVTTETHVYAIARSDSTPVELSDAQRDTLVPEDAARWFEPHSGVVASWPPFPDPDGNTSYNTITRTAQPATFVESRRLEGRDAAAYHVEATDTVRNPAITEELAAFPTELPSVLLGGLLQAGVIPEQSREAVTAALPTMPATVPVSFASTRTADTVVDTQFGAPLTTSTDDTVYVTVDVAGQAIPVLPISRTVLTSTPEDTADLADRLSAAATQLRLVSVYLPLALGVAGVVLIVIGVARRRRA